MTEIAKSEPLPPKLTICGLVAALSVIVRVPVLLPATVGVKAILIAQVAPAAKLVPQLLVWEKSPVVTMLVIVKGEEPVLLRVTV